jgi:hypothetical protein
MKTIIAFVLGATVVGISSGVIAQETNGYGYGNMYGNGAAYGNAQGTGKFKMSIEAEGSMSMDGASDVEGNGQQIMDGTRYYGIRHDRYLQTSCVLDNDSEVDTFINENGLWST